ncbi:MAG: hypothetical protein LBJ93_02555 [Clostridiales bacterium]|jgi:hypothetical protein|nr:hypothetical protein [Clostridiales bacterium]
MISKSKIFQVGFSNSSKIPKIIKTSLKFIEEVQSDLNSTKENSYEFDNIMLILKNILFDISSQPNKNEDNKKIYMRLKINTGEIFVRVVTDGCCLNHKNKINMRYIDKNTKVIEDAKKINNEIYFDFLDNEIKFVYYVK